MPPDQPAAEVLAEGNGFATVCSSVPLKNRGGRVALVRDQSPLSVRLTDFEVSDGTTVRLPPFGITLFVGPNNAGKSQTLRDLIGLIGSPQSYIGRAVSDISVAKTGSNTDFMNWVQANVASFRDASGQIIWNVGDYGRVPLGNLSEAWDNNRLQHIGSLLVYHADASSRLGAGSSVPNVNFSAEPATQPLQRAYLNGQIEKDLKAASKAAFGIEVGVDRFAGSTISLRVGDIPTFDHEDGIPAADYLTALRGLPLLEEQGDGMRSYLGLLLHLFAGAHQITLVDEPEAFLHPPQARLLGNTLASRASESQQIFMATHSVDILQGVLDSGAPTTIARITRDGNQNHVAVLDPDQVKTFWSDPLLRYSNLLDGLFHDAVILCEGDADCRYYNSVLDSMVDSGEVEQEGRLPQLLFSHCGGKARISSVVTSLRAAAIPTVIIADFDILNDAALLERVVVAQGGDFDGMHSAWAVLNGALTSDAKAVSRLAIREALISALDSSPGATIDKKEAGTLRGIIKIESGWDKIKRGGISAVPGGDAYAAAESLLKALEAVGILVVPVGELERFVPSVSGHGPPWVTEVHNSKLHADVTNRPPRDFVRKIIKAVSTHGG